MSRSPRSVAGGLDECLPQLPICRQDRVATPLLDEAQRLIPIAIDEGVPAHPVDESAGPAPVVPPRVPDHLLIDKSQLRSRRTEPHHRYPQVVICPVGGIDQVVLEGELQALAEQGQAGCIAPCHPNCGERHDERLQRVRLPSHLDRALPPVDCLRIALVQHREPRDLAIRCRELGTLAERLENADGFRGKVVRHLPLTELPAKL